MSKQYKVLRFDYVDYSKQWELPNYTKRIEEILNKFSPTHVPVTVTSSHVILESKN